jgi:mannose-6-phosphate isomerase-like protein (cupin superfamily)
MASEAAILHLLSALRRDFAQRGLIADEAGAEALCISALLDELPLLSLPSSLGIFTRNQHPATRHLDDALVAAGGPTVELLTAIRPVAHDLPWRYSYERREDAPSLGEKIAYAEIVGPDAPYRSAIFCLGLTLIAPESLYPLHRHPAVELYYVLSGTATWSLNHRDRDLPPGEFVLHPSLAAHAMRTRREPLLAVYTWSGGDIHTPSVYVEL